MNNLVIEFSVLLVCLKLYNVIALNLPGPRVFVVTPRPLQTDKGRSVPFYYHNWMRRMDEDFSVQNTTTTTPKVAKEMTPDLIFAEFESDRNNGMQKTIRKLLENERVTQSTTTTVQTTSRPIYVPDEDIDEVTRDVNYGLPVNMEKEEKTENKPSGPVDYFSLYNKLHEEQPSPIYLPFTTQSTTAKTTTTPTTTPKTSEVENVWHIIDSEKINKYSGNWDEVPINSDGNSQGEHKLSDENKTTEKPRDDNDNGDEINENYALPGFGTYPGNGAENESRAIRTEPNIRFPYVNLKPFQLKPSKKPFNSYSPDIKKTNNLMTNLNNFYDLKHPVRGEAQDVVPMREVIDRYNPAQPYLPPTDYGSKYSKQNSVSTVPKATANLVPPPPPPAPKITDNDFPSPTSYESFPPYAVPSFDSGPPAPKPSSILSPSPPAVATSDDAISDDSDNLPTNKPSMDIGYRYRPPSPVQQFLPTQPPSSKPFTGYLYNKPPMEADSPMMPAMDAKPDFHGYHYTKPESAPLPSDHDAPPAPPSYGYHDVPPSPSSYGHHDAPPSAPSYGHHDAPPSYGHDSDYPELIFQKHHHNMDDSKGDDDMKGMKPPPPADMKPADNGPSMDDHGFPSDFPGDFKYHHDIDDHDFYHDHHHHPTTTTTTTEMPRVNRYSYYYLGKKLYYLPLYFSVYFIVYVGALIIKAVLRHKIVYPNSWRPNDTTAAFFSKRSVDSYLSHSNLHDVTGRVTHAIATAAEKYLSQKSKVVK